VRDVCVPDAIAGRDLLWPWWDSHSWLSVSTSPSPSTFTATNGAAICAVPELTRSGGATSSKSPNTHSLPSIASIHNLRACCIRRGGPSYVASASTVKSCVDASTAIDFPSCVCGGYFVSGRIMRHDVIPIQRDAIGIHHRTDRDKGSFMEKQHHIHATRSVDLW